MADRANPNPQLAILKHTLVTMNEATSKVAELGGISSTEPHISCPRRDRHGPPMDIPNTAEVQRKIGTM